VFAQEVALLKGNGHNKSDHDAECSPHLPHHGQGTTDCLGCRLGSIDRSGAGFGANRETECKAGDEKIVPARDKSAMFVLSKPAVDVTCLQQPSRCQLRKR
jgi:hypothetical protein